MAFKTSHLAAALLFALWLLTACRSSGLPADPAAAPTVETAASTPTAAARVRLPVAAPGEPTSPEPEDGSPPPTAPPPAAPFPLERAAVPCGNTLPLLPPVSAAETVSLDPRPVDLALVEERLPAAALSAFQWLLAHPDDVALVAFQAGREAEGVYLNADRSMPVASVVKWLHLVAYAEAVAAGELDPLARVPLSELERYYLPGSDLRAHERAIEQLRQDGRVTPAGEILLEDVAAIMMRYSSNAASDYLHIRLGQARLEQTAVDLGLATQTAPCPFLGQFLIMDGRLLPEGIPAGPAAAFADPDRYGQAVMDLAETFSRSAAFRARVGRWRVPLAQQMAFVDAVSPQASAADYSRLLVRLAQNGLSSGDSSFFARRLAEWPMRFAANQAHFDNLAYKDGSLPGVLTLTYSAYRRGDPAPVVVVFFLRNLPRPTYFEFRRSLANDELARWLLIDPPAIPLLRRALQRPLP